MRQVLIRIRKSHRAIYLIVFVLVFAVSAFSFRKWDMTPDILVALILSSSIAGAIVFILGFKKNHP